MLKKLLIRTPVGAWPGSLNGVEVWANNVTIRTGGMSAPRYVEITVDLIVDAQDFADIESGHTRNQGKLLTSLGKKQHE